MEEAIVQRFELSKRSVSTLVEKETARRELVRTASLFRTILVQQTLIFNSQTRDSQAQSSIKQDLSKLQHEKKLLEGKVTLLASEIDVWKKKSASYTQLQKENTGLKNQVSKLTSQLNESKNSVGKVKQQFVTQKAVLESKLENAKKNIKTLKNAKSPVKTQSLLSPLKNSSLLSPVKTRPSGNPLQRVNKTLAPSFSVSPFLRNRTSKETSTPLTTKIMAQSTPTNTTSPLKDVKKPRPSSLKNLLSPEKVIGPKKGKPSLFDDDDDDDDDGFFTQAMKKHKETIPVVESSQQETVEKENIPDPKPKPKKRKLGGQAIVEGDEPEFSPFKKVKLMDKLGGMSPLKQRNKESGLFKV